MHGAGPSLGKWGGRTYGFRVLSEAGYKFILYECYASSL